VHAPKADGHVFCYAKRPSKIQVSLHCDRRTSEIGVRVALGASRGNVMRMVLAEAVGMVGAGLVIGTPLALWTKQIATRLIPGLTAEGAVWILLGAVAMLAIALLAAYLPARRASRVEPIVALRYE
jgi:ABC-type antimicrobial peptide transport system permease subunit